jgi:urease accessory protein
METTMMGSTAALAQLAWLQLHDSAFPTGRFVHSNGLEAWLGGHPSAGESDVVELARSYLVESVAALDAVAVAHAWSAERLDDQLALDRLVTSYKVSESARIAS